MSVKPLFNFSIARTSLIAFAVFSVSSVAQTGPERPREIAGLNPTDAVARSSRIELNRTTNAPSAPTEVYRIGVNDVVRIDIKDVPGIPRMARVLSDGTIEFPLAGEFVILAGKTMAEAESTISRSIKLIHNAHVRVRVSEYLSHTISVWGLVDQPGDQQIQRDAVPFYVIRAMTGIDPRADRVRITHAVSARTDEYALNNRSLDEILVYPGDSIEFADGGIAGK